MITNTPTTERYAKVVEISKRVRWEIERDVIRGRAFDYGKTFLPAGLSLVDELGFLSPADQRLLSQVQGRSYAYIFGLVERFIAAKVMQMAQAKALDDQVALEALVRMTDEELKHQAMFRRLETMMAADMPPGYAMTADANAVAQAVLGASTWAVLALTLDIELFTQAHYRASIEPDADLSPLWKDVFLFHWREESQHAILDEIELLAEDARLSKEQRDAAVGELIALVTAVDGILQAQAAADAGYFIAIAGTACGESKQQQIRALVLKAYRWQYIVSGVMEPRFQKVLSALVDAAQGARIQAALAPLMYAMPAPPRKPLPMAA
jgi:P-aminobenzoate N-oxygenase AurF